MPNSQLIALLRPNPKEMDAFETLDQCAKELPKATGERRLHLLEETIRVNGLTKDEATARMWIALKIIREEGLWMIPQVRDPNNPEVMVREFESFTAYATNRMAMYDKASERTIFYKMDIVDKLDAMNLDLEDQVEFLKNPAATAELLSLGKFEGQEFIGIDPNAKQNIYDMVQANPNEDERAVLRDFMKGALSSGDSVSSIVSRVSGQWKFYMKFHDNKANGHGGPKIECVAIDPSGNGPREVATFVLQESEEQFEKMKRLKPFLYQRMGGWESHRSKPARKEKK